MNVRSCRSVAHRCLNLLSSQLLIFFVIVLLTTPGAAAMPAVERTVLSNKLVVLVAEEHTLPFVTVHLLIDCGSRKDPPGREGIARLAARGLLLGTSKRSAEEINREVDFLGAYLTSSAGSDWAALNLKILKKDMDRGMDLFMDVLMNPVFPGEEIRREIDKTMAAIRAAEDQPDDVAEKAFNRELFLSPYGHPPEGTVESLPRIDRDAVERFYRDNYHPNNAILVVVGDITPVEVKTRILPRFEEWKEGTVFTLRFKTAFAGGPKTVKINRPVKQANIVIGHEGISRGDRDFYALSVMNYVLGGGGFASRLFDEIRNKRGLAYSVASYLDSRKYPGSFQIALQTKNASAGMAMKTALKEMRKIRRSLVRKKELEDAKKYLIGSFPMRIDTQEKLARFLGQVEYYGLGLDYPDRYPSLIGAVTRGDVLRVARKYLHPEKCLTVIVADLKEAGLEEKDGS